MNGKESMAPRQFSEHGDALYSIEEVYPDSTPGSRLRGLRHKEGVTQKDMADRLGVRQNHLSEMERGRRPITVDMAKRIADKFGTSYRIFV